MLEIPTFTALVFGLKCLYSGMSLRLCSRTVVIKKKKKRSSDFASGSLKILFSSMEISYSMR